MNTRHIITSSHGTIRTITISRPDRRNALTHQMYADLAYALKSADEDPSVRVIHLRGAGSHFTSGNDLQDFLGAPPTSLDAPVFHFLEAIRTVKKPVVAEVRGVAVGIGTTLLLHCDLIYCDDTARFQLPFANLGLCPEAGISLLLPRMTSHQVAAELLMLGEMFDANRACELGLVNAITAPDQLEETVMAVLQRLAAQPAASIKLTKSLLKQSHESELANHMTLEAEHFLKRLKSLESAEAMSAFLEKRSPDFSVFD